MVLILPYSGATPETVKKAFELLLSDTSVTAIFVNIFGGKAHLTCKEELF